MNSKSILINVANKNMIGSKQEKGITLIALVVTIIVLLILAAITIALVFGNNGIIAKVDEARIKGDNATVFERIKLKVADYQIEIESTSVEKEILSSLKQEGYINSDNTVNIQNLIGATLSTGNGNLENGDIYVLEKEDTSYDLIYKYPENDKETNIGEVFTEGEQGGDSSEEELYEPTSEDYFEFDEETGCIALKDSDDYYGGFDNEVLERNLGLDTIVVPSTYKGHTVTGIGIMYSSEVHWPIIMGINAADVKKIILPDTITEINRISIYGSF